MIQPLDCCTNSNGCTVGLVDVHCFSGELVEPFIYKYPYPSIFSCSLNPLACENPYFVYVLSVCEFLVLMVWRFLKFRFKEVTSLSLVHFYVVMLLECCLMLLVLTLAKLSF